MPITFARRQGWFKEPKIDEGHERTFSLEERWKRWRDREEIKRLGFAALVSPIPHTGTKTSADDEATDEQVFDSMGTALWNHESSSLYLDAAKTTLPCHDSLWARLSFSLPLCRADPLGCNRKLPPPPPGNPSSAVPSSPLADSRPSPPSTSSPTAPRTPPSRSPRARATSSP